MKKEDMLSVSLNAVKKAMKVASFIQEREIGEKETITKSDNSPVTIADFSVQALVCSEIKDIFPEVPIVGEERGSSLLDKPSLKEKIVSSINCVDKESEITYDNLLDKIDLGSDSANNQLFWTIDPIDGTKGFLRGEQYVIALALIEKGIPVLGVLGCPKVNGGTIFFAIKGKGAFSLKAEENLDKAKEIKTSSVTETKDMRFVQSYESSHGNLGLQEKIAFDLGIKRKPLQLDSQVKYAMLASGNAEIYLRVPNPNNFDYREKIWDHAAGSLILKEAGGIVSDIYGEELDFSQGITLKKNKGIIATSPFIYKNVLTALKTNLNL